MLLRRREGDRVPTSAEKGGIFFSVSGGERESRGSRRVRVDEKSRHDVCPSRMLIFVPGCFPLSHFSSLYFRMSSPRSACVVELIDVEKVSRIRFLIWVQDKIVARHGLPDAFSLLWKDKILVSCVRECECEEKNVISTKAWSFSSVRE